MSFPDFRILIDEGIVFVQLKLRRSRQVLGLLLLSLLSVGFIWSPKVHPLELSRFSKSDF